VFCYTTTIQRNLYVNTQLMHRIIVPDAAADRDVVWQIGVSKKR
jgi:hypothetical protein